MRIDLTDTTFIIPVRIDSMIRLENLLMSVDSIVRYFRTRILILETSSYQNEIIPSLIKDDTVKYTFLVDKDPVFYKTKYLNILAKQVDTPLVCIWDADVILDHLQILDAVKQLRTRTSDVAYPYDGNFLDTSDILREHYWLHRDLDFLKKPSSKDELFVHSRGSDRRSRGSGLRPNGKNTCKRVWRMRISMAGAWRTEKDITVG